MSVREELISHGEPPQVSLGHVFGGDDAAVLLPSVLANATAAKTTTPGLLSALSETVAAGYLSVTGGVDHEQQQPGSSVTDGITTAADLGSRIGRLVLNASVTTGQGFEDEFFNGSGSSSTSSFNESLNDMPQIPEYIRATSMVFCIIIMCLGVIGNIMVRYWRMLSSANAI